MQKVYFFGEYEPWKSQSKGALPYLEMEGGWVRIREEYIDTLGRERGSSSYYNVEEYLSGYWHETDQSISITDLRTNQFIETFIDGKYLGNVDFKAFQLTLH
jgi:hypothetical protein